MTSFLPMTTGSNASGKNVNSAYYLDIRNSEFRSADSVKKNRMALPVRIILEAPTGSGYISAFPSRS